MFVAVDNFYAAEPLLIARLRDQLPGSLKTIDSVDLLAGVENIAKYLDAVFVMPSPMDAVDSSEQGGVVVDKQDFQVTVCVQHIKDADNPAATDQAAGAIMFQVFKSLAGYALGPGFQAVRYDGRGAPFYGRGYAEYPLYFSVTAVIGN